jgi:SIR2-like protein
VELDFPAIYTTNYDRNLETAFEVHARPYAKVSNAKDIASAKNDVTHIIKYHGDVSDDASLVITETDFLNRLSFDSPLDIKFRSDALGRTILFIGYSMSIRISDCYIIWQTWEGSEHKDDRPQSFVFMPSRNPVQEALLARCGITVLTPKTKTGSITPWSISCQTFRRECWFGRRHGLEIVKLSANIPQVRVSSVFAAFLTNRYLERSDRCHA